MIFFFQAEDGIRDLVRSRGLGDVYKRQVVERVTCAQPERDQVERAGEQRPIGGARGQRHGHCLLYTSDAADERSSVDLGGRRIIKKKKIPEMRAIIIATPLQHTTTARQTRNDKTHK